MKVIFNRKDNELIVTNIRGDIKFTADSVVRNELNGLRSLKNPDDVVYHIPEYSWEQGKPYMPRPFPEGEYLITGAEETNKSGLAPFIIRTNCEPMVETWILDNKGCYSKPSTELVKDTGYLIHFGEGPYTLGCIRIINIDGIILLSKLILKGLTESSTMELKVI